MPPPHPSQPSLELGLQIKMGSTILSLQYQSGLHPGTAEHSPLLLNHTSCLGKMQKK